MNVIRGNLLARDGDLYAVVTARFNELVTARLTEGAVATLKRHGVPEEAITLVEAPGSFELPLIAERLAGSGNYAAVICLGAVIQGETSHHEYINQSMAQGLSEVSRQYDVPVLFGVLTCHTMEQALDRAGGKTGNKGSEAALAAIEMANLLAELPRRDSER